MNVISNKAWRELIYTLIYPALLGSMLYDIFSPSKMDSWQYASQVIIVCIYLVDYLYLYNYWMDQGYPTKRLEIIVDGCVAVFYRLSFLLINKDHPTWATLLLGLVFFLYLFYEAARNKATKRFIIAALFISLVNLPFSRVLSGYELKALSFAITAFLVLVLYSFFVFYYGPKYVFPERGAKAQST